MSSNVEASSEDGASTVEDDENFFTETEVKASPITPGTRRLIIASLAVIALAAIIAEVILIATGSDASEALLTVAATAVGGLAGLAMPGQG